MLSSRPELHNMQYVSVQMLMMMLMMMTMMIMMMMMTIISDLKAVRL